MKVGDLVRRKKRAPELEKDGKVFGIVISKSDNRIRYRSVSVLYPSVGKYYDVSESLLEVVSENR